MQGGAAKSRFALDVKEGRGGLVARYARAAVCAPRKFLGLSLGVCVLLSAIAMSLKAFNLAEESNYDWIVKSDHAVRIPPLTPPAPLPPPARERWRTHGPSRPAFNPAPPLRAPPRAVLPEVGGGVKWP